MLDAFRREIFETEKSRTDLLKWKMFLVAAIGSFGLGFSKDFTPLISKPLLLCLIPLVCVYVDSLCRHLQLRILTISEFYSRYRPEKYEAVTCFSSYEEFCHKIRSAPSLEELREEQKQLRGEQTKEEQNNSKQQNEKKIDVFDLEDLAMKTSTQILSFLLVLIPLALFLLQNYGLFFTIKIDLQQDVIDCMLWLMFSGFIGLYSSKYINSQYEQKREVLEIVSELFANGK